MSLCLYEGVRKMNYIEKYFFKVRNVYITNMSNKDRLKPVERKPSIYVDFFDLKRDDLIDTLFNIYENREIAKKYSARDNKIWKLIIAYYNKEPIGAFWILEPAQSVFYDSIEINKNQLLFCSVYVKPIYRGKGIYNQMHNKAFEYWEKNCQEKEVITIVEKSNVASNRSNQKYGLEILGRNYLIKFMGKNIVSIYKTKSFQKKSKLLEKF
jgi:GNAT superfamily N-acetyltransferase